MKAQALRKKTDKDLIKSLNEKQIQFKNARFEHKLGGLKQTHLLQSVRREISLIKTILHAREHNHDK